MDDARRALVMAIHIALMLFGLGFSADRKNGVKQFIVISDKPLARELFVSDGSPRSPL